MTCAKIDVGLKKYCYLLSNEQAEFVTLNSERRILVESSVREIVGMAKVIRLFYSISRPSPLSKKKGPVHYAKKN
jgi:hypothetical protein